MSGVDVVSTIGTLASIVRLHEGNKSPEVNALLERASLSIAAIAELIEAATPFVGLLQEHNDRDRANKMRRDEHPVFGINDCLITLGDLRRLRAALSAVTGGAK